ncbi:hypothetical protein K1719_022945 [Acacia pycnantha]|nr:hypothetical protein K1719_022945 [Acacia pycnantha]
MSSLASSYPHPPKLEFEYDVCLTSFNPEEGVSAFIKNSLRDAGFKFFIHDCLKNYDWKMIDRCRITVLVITPQFVRTYLCLVSLRNIIVLDDKTVLPFFYGVSHNEARVQFENFILGTYKNDNATGQLDGLNQRAGAACNSLYGFTLSDDYGDKDREIVKNLVARAISQVGLQPRVNEVLYQSGWKPHHRKQSTIIVGIWGIGGIGKTTIVRAIYDAIGCYFNCSSFLANIKDVWENNNGQALLQRQLLSDIQVNNMKQGDYRGALIVLDDVNQGSGFPIEMGMQVLIERSLVKVDHDKIHVHDLLQEIGRQITTNKPKTEAELLDDVVQTITMRLDNNKFIFVAHHPVGLESRVQDIIQLLSSESNEIIIIGIWGMGDWEVWKQDNGKVYLQEHLLSSILKTRRIKLPNAGMGTSLIKETLCHKTVLLVLDDDRSYATQILDGCGLHAKIGITHLIERSLVKVVKFGNKNILDMHGLLHDMGREIIRGQSPEEPEKRTRLWLNDDVLNVLENNIGTITIKGLSLNMSRNNSVTLSTKAFQKINRLCLLNFSHVQLNGDYAYLSKELRWFCWHGFLLENLPTNFNLEKIVVIDLKWSNLTKVWEKSRVLESLKILNLSHSHCLTKHRLFKITIS